MSGAWGYGTVLKIFLWGYLLGGLTLLPAVLTLAWFLSTTKVDAESPIATEKERALEQRRQSGGSTHGRTKDDTSLGVGLDEEILDKLKNRSHEPDTFAGYFAVCREYVPGGVNGKPPDRLTPAGAVVSVESPSVYQSMYRSIFDRNKTASPSMDAAVARSKKARNVFYVVLRLGHLMLYDNEDQIEVRHVISLAHYRADVYAGGENIPEGELWIKRNCIRLVQKHEDDAIADTKSFYLFSDNCSEKEDFYHAVLHAQEHHQDHPNQPVSPVPLKFETSDLVKLVQQLHASEENLHTRWINALIGRVFLALYKTNEVKEFIATKITKKIARVPKPALISSIALRSIDMGTLPPFLTNPKLKELTVDGDLVVEADISYKGNVRIEIAAIARIELGTRFKAREVTLVLATILKKLDGHILIRIKPPPSNRLWMTFETPPRMELSLEPIVSSRQITYGVILRAMESRIREVVNETLVLPNWDDMPFTDTIAQAIRGGIWHKEDKEKDEKSQQTDVALENATIDAEKLDEKVETASSNMSIASSLDSDDVSTGLTSSADYKSSSVRPRTMRSSSSAAQVQIDSSIASAEIVKDNNNLTPTSVRSLPLSSPMKSPLRPEKANTIAAVERTSADDLSSGSLSADGTSVVSLPIIDQGHGRTRSKELSTEEIASAAAAAAAAASAAGAHSNKKTTFNQSLNSATAAARNWLASKQSAQNQRKTPTTPQTPNTNGRPLSREGDATNSDPPIDSSSQPIGRGQPLPPPGTPLPRPEKRQTWTMPSAAASTFANIAKRKPVAPSSPRPLSENPSKEHLPPLSHSPPKEDHPHHDTDDWKPALPRRMSAAATTNMISNANADTPPPLPKRRQRQPSLTLHSTSHSHSHAHSHHRRSASSVSLPHTSAAGSAGHDLSEALFVVEAPLVEGSVPSTPVEEGGDGKEKEKSGSKSSSSLSLGGV